MAGQAKLSILIAAKDDSAGALAKARGAITGIAKAAVGAGLVAGAAIGGIALATVGAASDLAESRNKVRVVFGDMAGDVEDFASKAATSLGQSEKSALEAAGTFGNLFKSMGVIPDVAADMSKEMVTLASDLSSFNNIPIAEVLDALRSGLVGEAEPMRKFGVLLDEATVAEKAMAMGLGKTSKELTQQDKVLARNALMLEQTKDAQGDFARTSDGLANRQRILKAQFQDVRATIGKAFLPAMEAGAKAVSDLLAGMKKSGAIDRFADLLRKVVTGAVNVARDALGRLRNIIATVKGVFKGEWVDSDKIDGISRVFGNLAKAIKEDVIPPLKEMWKWLGPKLKDAFSFLVANKETIGKALLAIAAGFVALKAAKKAAEGITLLKVAIKGLGLAAHGALGPVGLLTGGAVLLATAWIENWGGIREKLAPAFRWLKDKLGTAWDNTEDLRTKIGELAGQAFEGLKSGWDTYGKPALDGLIQAHRDAWPIVSDLILRLGELANAAFQGVQDGWNNILKPTLEAIGLKFDPDTKDAIKKAHDELNDFAGHGMKDTADMVHHTLNPALKEAVVHHDFLTMHVKETSGVFNELSNVVWPHLQGAWNAILKPVLTEAGNTLRNHLAPAIGVVIDIYGVLWLKQEQVKLGMQNLMNEGVTILATGFQDKLSDAAGAARDALGTLVTTGLDKVRDGLGVVGDAIRDLQPFWDALGNKISGPIAAAFGVLNRAIDRVAAALRYVRDLINSIKIPSWLGGMPPAIPGPKPTPQRASMNIAAIGPTGGSNNLAAIEEAVYRGAYRGTRAALAEAI